MADRNEWMYQNVTGSIQAAFKAGDITAEQAEQALAKVASDFEMPPVQLQSSVALEEKRAKEALELANPDKVSPWGTETTSTDANGNVTVTQTLNPTTQAALDSQQALGKARSDAALGMMGNVNNAYSQPMDWSGLTPAPDSQGARDQAINSAYGQATSRLDPRFAQDENALRTRLYNQGFREGDQGFQTEIDNFSRNKNDAYTSAMNSAIGQGTSAMQALFGMGQTQHQQELSDMLQQRNQPMNEMNALISGQQVQSPNMPGYTPVSAPNYAGAAANDYSQGLDTYNANQAQKQANNPLNQIGQYAPYVFGF